MKFKGEEIKKFRSYFKLSKEINRCKGNLKITSVYVNKDNELIIKVKDKKTKEEFAKPWIEDAFEKGITIIPMI